MMEPGVESGAHCPAEQALAIYRVRQGPGNKVCMRATTQARPWKAMLGSVGFILGAMGN